MIDRMKWALSRKIKNISVTWKNNNMLNKKSDNENIVKFLPAFYLFIYSNPCFFNDNYLNLF